MGREDTFVYNYFSVFKENKKHGGVLLFMSFVMAVISFMFIIFGCFFANMRLKDLQC